MTGGPATGRWAVVLAGYRAVPPPGIAADSYAEACLADSYEVIAGLSEIRAGLAGDAESLEEIRWPSDRVFAGDGRSVRAIADQLDDATELIVVAADVPDLPELIIAKIAKALARADVALAPEIGGAGLAAAGVRLPWPAWLDRDLDLDLDPYQDLGEAAPRRNLVVHTPGWHRLRTPEAVHRLDPRLEGWDNVRLLITAPLG
ncbi:hypothetical protein [Microlunatus soli]|uniref:MobA-like NTP transferase domain-containing protein n=1 Tax=Microlunatus soli TaxID=630515 RepID=A0A1H1MMT5_9ACTN|nr:hypothetical protein [Microlunatus soli]SDR88027.1 hypothetical protein SAMN04489812_0197 [Microlunatus soli]